MIRGTTPYIKINTDTDLTRMGYVVFTMEDSAGTEINVDSESGRMEVTADAVLVRLTQEETLSLAEGDLQMQLRAASSNGAAAIASNVMYAVLDNVLNEEVIP